MKTTQTFGVRIIALTKKNNSNEALIYARVTIAKKVIDISLKRTTVCSLWDSKRECVSRLRSITLLKAVHSFLGLTNDFTLSLIPGIIIKAS